MLCIHERKIQYVSKQHSNVHAVQNNSGHQFWYKLLEFVSDHYTKMGGGI